MTWEEGDWFYWLERSPEQHLWKVKKAKKMQKEGEQGATAGWIAVYVDDFLVTMPTTEIAAAFRRITRNMEMLRRGVCGSRTCDEVLRI